MVSEELPQELMSILQGQPLTIISSLSPDQKIPEMHAISWVHALSLRKLQMLVGLRSRVANNLLAHSEVGLVVFGMHSVFSVQGVAVLRQQRVPEIPIPLTLFAIEVQQVRDVMFFGAKVLELPRYGVTYDHDAAERLREAVSGKLRDIG